MSASVPPAFSRAWLLSEAPVSRGHANWVRRYRGWLEFRRNGACYGRAGDGLRDDLRVIGGTFAYLAGPGRAESGGTPRRTQRRLTGSAPTSWAGTSTLRILYGGRVTLGMVVAVVLLVAPIGLAVWLYCRLSGRARGSPAHAGDRRVPGLSPPGARTCLRRRVEAWRHQRRHRDRTHRLAALCTPGPGRDVDHPQQRPSLPPSGSPAPGRPASSPATSRRSAFPASSCGSRWT